MLALMEERRNFETRAFLIAKSISRDLTNLCEEYEVECFVVKIPDGMWIAPKKSSYKHEFAC